MIWIGISCLAIVLAMAAVMYAMRVRASRAKPISASRVEETSAEEDDELGVTRLGVPRFDLDAALARRSPSQHD
jgi:hypothetical protein